MAINGYSWQRRRLYVNARPWQHCLLYSFIRPQSLSTAIEQFFIATKTETTEVVLILILEVLYLIF